MTRSEQKLGDSDGERETPWARATWIDEENTLTMCDERPVGVTGKHYREPRGCGLETEFPEVMNYVQGMGPDLDYVIGRQLGGPRTLVVVTPDSANRGDSPKRVENRESPDVSAMDDEITSAKLHDSLRPDETVRVRDHTDNVPGFHGCLTLGISGGAKRCPLHAVVTPLRIQVMNRCARERSCLSRLPSRATRARVLPRQEEIAARLAA